MKNNRIRLTSYISPDLDELIIEYMENNNISTKSQALERILIEFKYMKNELNFLRNLIKNKGNDYIGDMSPETGSKKRETDVDKVKTTIDDIFSNMPD